MNGPVPIIPAREEFEGKTAVITGGTDGIGLHVVQALASLGAQVYFCGRNKTKGEAAEASLGSHGHFVQCDLADVKQASGFARTAGEAAGRIDYLVNNAAIDPRIPFATATVADFDRLIAVNTRPFFVVAQTALPYLEAGAGKSIVNVCTTNYMVGLSPFTLYNASKSAIIGFTRSLARELGPSGIRANVVSPGWIMTAKQLREHVTDQDKQELLAIQSIKTLMTPGHVVPAILFFLSGASAGITGQNLVVDGGRVMY